MADGSSDVCYDFETNCSSDVHEAVRNRSQGGVHGIKQRLVDEMSQMVAAMDEVNTDPIRAFHHSRVLSVRDMSSFLTKL